MTRQIRRLAALVFLCAVGAGCEGEVEEIVVEEGYRGRARVNPFLAAWRLLESRDWRVEERHGLAVLPPSDHVVVLSAGSDENVLAAEELAAWVREGGHAVYLLSGFERFADELDSDPEGQETNPASKEDEDEDEAEDEESGEEEGADGPVYPLLKSLNLQVVPRPQATRFCQIGDKRLKIEMPPGVGIEGPKGVAGVSSLPIENGRLTILGDAQIWRNRHIGKHQHATLFWEVMELHGRPIGAWFLSDTEISFFALLWSHGWMPLMGLALFVVTWLWRSIPRFGPLLPDPAPASRDFLGHLSQAGAFLWSRGGPDTLIAPLRQSILQRAFRSRAQDDSGGGTEEQWETLSRSTGLPTERLREALLGEVPRHRRRFVELISTLQTISSSVS